MSPRALSVREAQILELLAWTGSGDRALAATLGISRHTVKTHLERIHMVLDEDVERTRAALVAWAWKSGWMQARMESWDATDPTGRVVA